MMSKRKQILLIASLIGGTDALVLLFVSPIVAYFFSRLSVIQGGLAGMQAFTQDMQTYLSTHLLDGFLLMDWTSVFAIPGYILIAVITIVLIYSIFKPKPPANHILDAQPPQAGSNEHGNTRFLRTPREIDKNTKLISRIMGEADPHNGGFYLGSFGNKFYLVEDDEHMMIIAPTRTGKTRRILLQMIYQLGLSDECMTIFDPKGELYGYCAPELETMGVRVNRIDFRDPTLGNHWNALQRIISVYHEIEDKNLFSAYEQAKALAKDKPKQKNISKLIEIESELFSKIQIVESEVTAVTNIIFPRNREREGQNTFFNNGAENLIKLALHYVCYTNDCPDGARIIKTVHDVIANYCKPVLLFPNGKTKEFCVPLFQIVQKFNTNHPAYKLMTSLSNTEAQYLKSFSDTALGQLSPFTSSAIANMMSATDIPLDEMCDEKTATFIIVPQSDKTYHQFALLYIDQLYQMLMEKAENCGGRLPRRMNMICEELAQLPPITELDQRLSLSAGMGIRWVLVLQDITQLEAKYGRDKAPTLINQCATKIFMRASDANTGKWISNQLGTYTINIEGTSSSKTPQSFFAQRVSNNTNLAKRERLTPREAQEWDPNEGVIVLQDGTSPIVLPAPDIAQMELNQVLHLGDRSFNQNKIMATRSKAVHGEPIRTIYWSPELRRDSSLLNDKELKELRSRKIEKLVDDARREVFKQIAQVKEAKEDVKKPKPPEEVTTSNQEEAAINF